MINLGIIGYRNHAQRLIKIIENNSKAELQFIYHPSKIINDKRETNNILDLFKCDGIIIASPNHTHLEYIIKLLKKNNLKIFCEKPPVNNEENLKILENLSLKEKRRIFFNFNFRFSDLSKKIEIQKKSMELEKIIQINIISTHGLAFKKEYKNSWRSDGKNNLHNILDTVAIHYIDLMNFHFGKINSSIYIPKLNSKTGTSFDTAQITLDYDNVITNIFTSYAAPMIHEISMIGINGQITFKDDFICVYSPRDNYDENGNFVKPNMKSKNSFSLEQDYEDSLKNSINFFINTVEKKEYFDLHHFESSISTTREIIKFHKLNNDISNS
jgi:predicted dehydrogenase